MRWLQCAYCHGPAFGGATRLYPEGEPLVLARISYFPYRYKCSRCKKLNQVTAMEWNRLPTLSEEENTRLGTVAWHGKLASVDDAGTTPAELREQNE